MRSAGSQLARLVNKSAVPYVAARQSFTHAFAPPAPMTAELKSFGTVGTLFAIVTKLANGTSQTDWKLWRKSKDGSTEGRTEVTNHLALSIWNKPNDFYTRQEFVETTGQHQELVGEQWWVVSRDPRSSLPLELWPVRPDRMRPVPDAENFLVGYIYTGPVGEEIPLERDQVIMLRAPDPESPYRGMGPVQTILPDLSAANMASLWAANFFTNSAQPGGVIEVEKRLSDDEFDEMTLRWREQHQGVANAHRVAVLEQGKYVQTGFSMKDMEFNALRASNSEAIREAFGFPKPLLGSVDDVNRANAEAAEYVFAKWLLVPRLERIKGALNNDFLPLFYPKGAVPDVEFDYQTPVPENEEFEATERKSKADALAVYAGIGGFQIPDLLKMLDLPDLPYEKPPPPPPPPAFPPPAPVPADPGANPPPAGAAANLAPSRHRPWPTMKADLPDEDHPDLTGVQVSWEQHLDDLIRAWTDITAAQKDDLIAQIHDVVSSGTPTDLLAVEAAADAGAAVLQQALISVGADAAAHVVEEADAQGETINPVPPQRETLISAALVTTGLIAAGLGFSAVREAQRVWNPAANAADVTRLVRAQLDTLSDAGPRAQLGAALTRAQRDGRINTLRAAPTTAWYASEQLDKNTCKNCRAINGKWLGNSIIDNVNRLYPTGGYVDCLGRDRCRGMVVGVWRPRQVGDQ